MTCARNCNSQDVQVFFSTANGSFSITVFDDADAFVTFDDDQIPINLRRDTLGNIYAAGSNYVIRPFTLSVPCSDESVALDDAYIADPLSMCGDLELITGCCKDQLFRSLRLVGVNAPDVGNEIGIYEFSFEGIPTA